MNYHWSNNRGTLINTNNIPHLRVAQQPAAHLWIHQFHHSMAAEAVCLHMGGDPKKLIVDCLKYCYFKSYTIFSFLRRTQLSTAFAIQSKPMDGYEHSGFVSLYWHQWLRWLDADLLVSECPYFTI